MNNLKCKLLKALLGVSLGALGAFVVTFVIYFWNLDMKLTSVMEGILLKHYDKIDRACKQFVTPLDDKKYYRYNA